MYHKHSRENFFGFAMAVVAFASTVLVACGNEDGGQIQTPVQGEYPLEVTYVSGHLGNYSSCADDSSNGAQDELRFAFDAGVCAQDAETCGLPLNCNDAELTVVVSNAGDEDLANIDVEQLIIIPAEGETIVATVLSVSTTDGEAFDGTLDAGAELTLRISFVGLAPGEGTPYGERIGADVRVTVGTGDEDVRTILLTPELQTLPLVVT